MLPEIVHDHSCGCGTSGPHQTGDPNCLRVLCDPQPELVTRGVMLDVYRIGGILFKDHTLERTLLICQHDCGCWTRPIAPL